MVNLYWLIYGKCLGDYKGDVPLTLVTDKRAKVGGLTPEIVKLKGIRYAVMQEPSKDDIINEGVLKQLTSEKILYREEPCTVHLCHFSHNLNW